MLSGSTYRHLLLDKFWFLPTVTFVAQHVERRRPRLKGKEMYLYKNFVALRKKYKN